MIDYKQIISTYQTPTYLYDIEILQKRITYLKEMLGNDIHLVYAVKANTFIAKEVENYVDGYEICSPGEFDICQKLDISPNKMVISGVYKDQSTIENMISNYDNIGRYTIESLSQWELLKELTNQYKRKIHVLIRLTSGNQFGVEEEDFRKIMEEKDQEFIEIEGIEYFSGTQKHSIKRIHKEIDYLLEFVEEIEKEFNFSFPEIEYGPGFPVFYYQDDTFDEEEFLKEFKEAIGKIKKKKVSLEIGRSIVASCGYYFTKVVDMKTNQNGNFVIMDGGIHHLVYYGQTMAMKIPYFEIYPNRNTEKDTYNLYGSLCTINDIIVKNIKVAKLQIGDVFIFKNVGAYSVTEGISLFLSRDLPKVVLRYPNQELKQVRDMIHTSDINFPNYK